MTTGRTNFNRWSRLYADGYDLSGYTREFGELQWEYDEHEDRNLAASIKGYLPGMARTSPGTVNGIFDNTATSGLHVVASGAGVQRTVMIPVGIRGVPAVGDPTYMGVFEQLSYKGEPGGESQVSAAMIDFGAQHQPTGLNYDIPWGALLHAKEEETDANTETGAGVNNGAASTGGGYLVYQIFSVTGTGTVTISIDDSADDSTYGALSGATTGAIAHTAVPAAGVIQLATNATVKQYLRWQMALDTITACTFALAFVRGR